MHEEIPWPTPGHYGASKGGLKLFGQSIARELAPKDPCGGGRPRRDRDADQPRVLDDPAVASGRRPDPARPEGQLPESRRRSPGSRAQASYVTGTTLFVDGGMTLYPKLV